jgi:UDP-N-acetylglucosamine transferase subunit ALG13
VCHAGIGTVSEVLTAKRPLIVVPRLKQYNEHMNDHQLDLARAVERRGWGRMILDVTDLQSACAAPPPAYSGYAPARAQLVDAVRTMVNDVAGRKEKGTRR